MDSPQCLSQNFVNKQNVRSFENILKGKLLKNEDTTDFLQHLIEEKRLVSEISPDLLQILCTLRINLRNNAKNDFKKYFSNIPEQRFLLPVNKESIFTCCWMALNEIIPKNFFGGNQNIKIFRKTVHTVIYSMKRQHFILSKEIRNWNFTRKPWNSMKIGTSEKILFYIIKWIMKYILSAMICLNFYVTTCKVDADEYKLHFFWKNQWQSYYDKKISAMIISKVLKRFQPNCLGKKAKRRHNLGERLKLKLLNKDIPKLHLVLKSNDDCRPIVRYKNDQHTLAEKYKFKERLNFLKTLTGKPREKVESQFITIYLEWQNLKRPKLYFIKTDLSNAFGSINRQKLMKILCERHLNFQKMEKNVYLKKRIAQQYKDMVSELRRPLLVRAGNTVYEWTEGLIQGYKYSPALSELYYSYLDEQYFKEHLKKSDCHIRFFIRVVDDYLYITDSLMDATAFLDALSNYRNVNYEKTVVNFEHKSIKFSNNITFLGYTYDVNSLQVSRASNVYAGQMCHKIAFSSVLVNISKFLENRIGQSGIQINSHIFNFQYNTEELVWQHIFTTFCLSANKFCTILAVLCDEKEMLQYLSLYKKRVAVKLGNTIIQTLMRNKPPDFLFMYCINHFRYLSFKSLHLCARATSGCSGLVPLINDEMAKSNCLFGKWKDHAARIETNGEIGRQAVKQVCRRTDLRKIVKCFDNLPDGFQCYNHRKLL